MRILLLFSILTSMITFNPLPKIYGQDDVQKAARAQELLTQTRAAMGSDKLKSLSTTGTLRQIMGEMEMAGEIELDMLLPDKLIKASTTTMMSAEITRLEAFNGETAWTDIRNANPGGVNLVMRVGSGNNTIDAKKALEITVRQEFARLLLGFIAAAPTVSDVKFSYAGEAEAPDGKADVINLKGELGFAAQLFLDQKTHLPLMVSYMGRKPRMMTRAFGSPDEAKKVTPEELEKQAKEAAEKAKAEPPVEFQMRFMEYREEGGVKLPHRLSRSMEGKITEEWELQKFKINPTIKADKFEKK